MPKLKTTNIFIDTQAFDTANLSFDATVFKELLRLAQAGRVKLFLTSVTESEIRAHIKQRIHEALQTLEKFRNNGRMLKNVTAFKPLFETFDEKEGVSEISNKFQNFVDGAEVEVLDLENTDVSAIFQDYFDQKPPFGQGKKKYEFPDAFAQQVLTSYCKENDCKMYVVSADHDWQSLDGRSKRLIPIETLQEVIDLAVKDEEAELSETALQRYHRNSAKVEKAIADEFKDSAFYASDVDGDVEKVNVTDMSIGEPRILEVDEGSATISVTVDVEYTADVSYYDDGEGIWDSEDDRWLYRPTKYEEAEESDSFEAELYIDFDPDNEKSFDVTCSISEDFAVTVLPTDYELK